MSFTLTKRAKNLKDQNRFTPQIVLEIDGVNLLISTSDVLRFPTFDEEPALLFDNGLYFDTPIPAENSRAYIDFKKSTKAITQTLIAEKGGAGDIQSFKIAIVNKNKELNKIFETEKLGKSARISIGFAGGSFPEDFNVLFDGFIESYDVEHGMFVLFIAHPDQLKRQTILNLVNTQLRQTITNAVINIPVSDISQFTIPTLEQEENFESYIRIGDEIMKLTQANAADEFQNVLRNQLRTIATEHDAGTEVQSYYRLKGNPITLALKLLLSDANGRSYAENGAISRFVKDSNGDTIENAIYFNFDIVYEYNVTEGDTCTVTGSASNDFVGRLIIDVFENETGTYIVVDGAPLTDEALTVAEISFKSKYNTMPTGLGLKPRHIDIVGIDTIVDLVGSTLPEIDIYVPEEIKAKEWIEKEIFKPSGLFFIPRKGRISIYAILPPLNTGKTIVFDETTIANITKLKVKRSTNKNFYNVVAYKFEEKSINTGEFRSGLIQVSETAFNNIGVGTRQLVIEAKCFRENPTTRTSINQRASRILNKYSSAPPYIKGIQVLYREGYNVEVGDVVLFGSENMQLPDGVNDYFTTRLMEITNKSLNIESGDVKFDIIDSAFGLNGRFPVVAPSSYIKSSPDAKTIILKNSLSTGPTDKETDRWEQFVGRKLKIRDLDFTKEQILTLKSFGGTNENALEFHENIIIAINDGDLIEMPDYEDASDFHKAAYGYITPQVNIDVVTSNSIVEADATNLFQGANCEVHQKDYDNISQEVKIETIVGNVITFSEPLNYLPSVNDKISLIGFASDEGLPYRAV